MSASTNDNESNVFLTQGNDIGVDRDSAAHVSFDPSSSDALTTLSSAGGGVNVSGIGGSGTSSSMGMSSAAGDHVSQSTRLHHKMREMKEMDDALALMKSDYSDRIRAVKDGESKFLVKQHNIIKYLKRFKLFILESDTKRARAEKKESEEHRQRLAKIKEIDALRLQFLALQTTRADRKAKNEHYKQNKNYLESVKDSVPEQYGEIDELIARYTILKNTNLDLTELNRNVNAGMESKGLELQHLYKTKQNDILVMNSRFASMLQSLEQVANETSGIENDVVASEVRTREMNRYLCEVQMAIQNIYARTMASLPSKNAATQMKKRMQAQEQAQKLRQAMADATGASGVTDAPGAAAAGKKDPSLSDDDTSRADIDVADPSLSGLSADDLASRSATIAANRSLALRQSAIKSTLFSRLDSIQDRIVDLQDVIVEVYKNGGKPTTNAAAAQSNQSQSQSSAQAEAATAGASGPTSDRRRERGTAPSTAIAGGRASASYHGGSDRDTFASTGSSTSSSSGDHHGSASPATSSASTRRPTGSSSSAINTPMPPRHNLAAPGSGATSSTRSRSPPKSSIGASPSSHSSSHSSSGATLSSSSSSSSLSSSISSASSATIPIVSVARTPGDTAAHARNVSMENKFRRINSGLINKTGMMKGAMDRVPHDQMAAKNHLSALPQVARRREE